MELALDKAQDEAGFAGAHVSEQDLRQQLMILIGLTRKSLRIEETGRAIDSRLTSLAPRLLRPVMVPMEDMFLPSIYTV